MLCVPAIDTHRNFSALLVRPCHGSHFLAVHPTQSPNLVTQCKEVLMNLFHEDGVVHGDLHNLNIFRNEDQVMIIGFNWGGKVDTLPIFTTLRVGWTRWHQPEDHESRRY